MIEKIEPLISENPNPLYYFQEHVLKINELVEQSNRQDEAIKNIAASLGNCDGFNKDAFELIETILSGNTKENI